MISVTLWLPFRGEVSLESVEDLDGDVGVQEEGRPDGQAGGAGEQELHGILPALDAAHADDGDAVLFGDLGVDAVGHVDGDGLDGGAGEAAGAVGQHGALSFDIDDHRGEGVDQARGRWRRHRRRPGR